MNQTAISRLYQPTWRLEDEDETSSHLHELEDIVQNDFANERGQPEHREKALEEKWRSEMGRSNSIIRSQKDLEHMIKHLRSLIRQTH